MTRALNDAQRKAIVDSIPAKRLGEVSDVASAALFLASNSAGYVTGTTLHINGGMYMG